jgi:hypothetical protein
MARSRHSVKPERAAMRSICWIIFLTCLFFLVFSAGRPDIWSYPLFPIKYGADCTACHGADILDLEGKVPLSQRKCSLNCDSCHVNPSGGGMRNQYARYYARNRSSMFSIPAMSKIEKDRQRIERYIQLGGDLRWAKVDFEDRKDMEFYMHREYYVAVHPLPYISFYYQNGRYPRGIDSRRESFLLIRDLPYNSYVKVGRFIPPFGLRIPDHTSWVRDSLNLGHFDWVDGVEFGTNPLIPFFEGAYFDEMGNKAFGNDPKGFSLNVGAKALVRAYGLT